MNATQESPQRHDGRTFALAENQPDDEPAAERNALVREVRAAHLRIAEHEIEAAHGRVGRAEVDARGERIRGKLLREIKDVRAELRTAADRLEESSGRHVRACDALREVRATIVEYTPPAGARAIDWPGTLRLLVERDLPVRRALTAIVDEFEGLEVVATSEHRKALLANARTALATAEG